MLMALAWWAILINRKNLELYQLRQKLSECGLVDVSQMEILSEYHRQKAMLIGEGTVFGLAMILGVMLIYFATKREMFYMRKEKNFLLSITHELKTPLATFRLIFDTLRRKYKGDTLMQELSDDGIDEVKRLEDLFDKILLASRLDSGIGERKMHGNFSDFTNIIIDKYRNLYKHISWDVDIKGGIFFDYTKHTMESILRNLLDNAIKYNDKNRPKIGVRIWDDSHHVFVKISSKGKIIPLGERKKIFEQFYRMGNEDNRKTKGMGLGLYIVKKLVEGYGGTVMITEGPPEGPGENPWNEFTIKFPKK